MLFNVRTIRNINILCGQSAKFNTLKQVVRIITTEI
jgi:hypothetical protein